jgi:hypothetical protein
MSLLLTERRQSSNQLNINCTFCCLSDKPFNNKHYILILKVVSQTILQHENRTLLGCYAASSGNLKMGPIGCPETSVRNLAA